MVKINPNQTLPTTVRIRDLKPGQVALQVDKEIVWTRVGNRLMFARRRGEGEWHLTPSNNAKVFVMPFLPKTQVQFTSVA